MKTVIVDLLFEDGREPLHRNPLKAHVYLKKFQRGKHGEVFLTSTCMSIREIDAEIKFLKAELSSIRAKAARRFRMADLRLSADSKAKRLSSRRHG